MEEALEGVLGYSILDMRPDKVAGARSFATSSARQRIPF